MLNSTHLAYIMYSLSHCHFLWWCIDIKSLDIFKVRYVLQLLMA